MEITTRKKKHFNTHIRCELEVQELLSFIREKQLGSREERQVKRVWKAIMSARRNRERPSESWEIVGQREPRCHSQECLFAI